MELLLTNIGVLATPTGNSARKGKAQGDISIVEKAAIGVSDGKIAYVGPELSSPSASRVIDCGGRLATPGLVDAHTHLVFGGWREKELSLKLAGVSYLDILKGGGGILNTVGNTRAATEAELVEKASGLLSDMLRHGTTTAECKSGYGLNLKEELKQLHVVDTLRKRQSIDLVSTFMGAHAVPIEYKNDREAYIRLICEEMLPAIAKDNLAEYCDIFCETAVFGPEESARILAQAKGLGFGLKVHADEIDPIGGAEMAAAAGCVSAEHLIQTSDQGIRDMAAHDVIAVLLPATSYYLDKPFARARKMIEEGVAVAVATDFNPGSCPNLNLQFPMNLACLRYRLTPAEVLTAVTLNAAASIGRSETTGTLETGKNADIVIWEASNLEYIYYRFGSNLVNTVISKGEVFPVR